MAVTRLIGASIPRSGHHFLVRLLQGCLGDAFRFCEFYTPANCCAQVPCARVTAARVSLQKNHDFDLRLPATVPGARYVVQYRNAVDAVLSDRELFGEVHGAARAADREQYTVWLGTHLAYMVGFAEKWLALPGPAAVPIAYEDLIADPAGALRAVCACAGEPVTDAALQAAVHAAAPFAGEHGERAYNENPLDQRRFAHWDLLAVFESWVVRQAPRLVRARRLPDAYDPAHLVVEIQRAEAACLAGAPADAFAPLDRALALAPDNPYLHLMRGTLLAALERWSEALAPLRRAAELRPADASVLIQLSLAQWRTGDAATACATAERLLQHHPGRDNFALHLAGLSLAAADERRAARLVERVLDGMAPAVGDLLWAADILAALQRPREALAVVERAVALAPEHVAAVARLASARHALGEHP
ncbi:MAG: sulfotransferase [Deltaproteobacteria bacterium]|nr:sulfotransferase [Deltaproteobacteria bacterium]